MNFSRGHVCSQCRRDTTHTATRRTPLGPRSWQCPHVAACGANNAFNTHTCYTCERPHPTDADGHPSVGLLTPDLALELPPAPAHTHAAAHPAGPQHAGLATDPPEGPPSRGRRWGAAGVWSEPDSLWRASDQARDWD